MLARSWASVSKSEYGLRSAARLTVASFLALTAARSDCFCFTTFVESTYPATPATISARAPSRTNAPMPPDVVIADGRGAPEPFCDERSSGVRRLTARME